MRKFIHNNVACSMRKFMHNNVAVKYKSIIVYIVSYNFDTEMYTVEDRQGGRIEVKGDELRYLTDK